MTHFPLALTGRGRGDKYGHFPQKSPFYFAQKRGTQWNKAEQNKHCNV
jgi:hypothetical protein